MKIWTYILTITVIFLSVKPGIDTITFSSESQQTCCLKSKYSPISEKHESDNKNDQETKGLCNPFQACCACNLVYVGLPFFPTLKIGISSEENFSYQSFISSKFISDFWQPPRFV